uniref:DUF7378 domain-containing protein n=1 Tax=Leersia perrieri TaxID=77586 RepID=A0A0D9UXB5_9ORYZ
MSTTRLLLPWAAAPAPTKSPTIGEISDKTPPLPRPLAWLVAFIRFVDLPPARPNLPLRSRSLLHLLHHETIITTLTPQYYSVWPITDPACVRRDPWRASPLLLWGAYMSAASMVSACTRLFLPRAPHAVLGDIDGVGAC